MDLFKTLKKTATCAAVLSAFALVAPAAHANTTTGTIISAAVDNTFTLVETQPMDFGSFVAINGTATANIVIDPTAGSPTYSADPGPNAGTAARLIQISTSARGIYDITGAAPNTVLAVTYPNSVTLDDGTAGPDFTIDTFTDADANVTTGTITTDGVGAYTIGLGATLHTDGTAAVYADGVYTGAITVTVTY